uniref:Retrovirus-related Pol polyprotein from transposon TNT 1-94 n=1 Tax=Tanacetum cinerariifolium TaxID=118510 RepID=A0A6L2N4A3_TANCI|nr:retrovirus-related Pol polyprotein from transposon TNT 1-94 [Tanacetum cinerariifolium]
MRKRSQMMKKSLRSRDELLVLKQAKLNAVTFQIQNTKLTKLNHALQELLKEAKKINEKWLTISKKVSQCISEQIPHQKKKVIGGELFTESSLKINENENLFVPASMGYDHEMVPKSKDWVERLNPDSILSNFNTGRVLVLESQAVNESLKLTETSITPKSSKDSKAESIIPLPLLKNLQGASQSLESVSGTVTVSETEPTTHSVPTEVNDTEQESKINELTKLVQMILYCMICKREDHRTSDHEMYTASRKRSENYKAQPYQCSSPSKQILKAKAKPFPPCTYYGFNDHKPDDCRHYPECRICRSYDHFTSGHNRVIHIRGGVLAKSSQSSQSSTGIKCNTCGSTVYSTANHNEFDYFKKVSPMSINHKKYTLVIVDEYSRERIPDISYFHMFGCHVFIHNHKDRLGKFDVKADDGYFLGYPFVSKAFKVLNIRRQQVEETYNVTFDESMEAIRFTNTLVNEIRIDDSSRYPPDEFLHEDDPSRL